MNKTLVFYHSNGMLPPASAIQNVMLDFVKSMQLACAGQNNRFGFPDCSINATQSLGATLHFGGFREHCPGLVQGNLLFVC